MTQRVLLDASNLHAGGGVQVAASLVDEWLAMASEDACLSLHPWLADVDMIVSTKVLESLRTTEPRDSRVRIIDHRPKDLPRRLLSRPTYDVSFTVFGPHYGSLPARRTILGYADVTSVYPRPTGVPAPTATQRARWNLRGRISRALLARHDLIAVETEAMQAQVETRVPATQGRVRVVSNAYNAIFDHPGTWSQPLAIDWSEGRPDMIFSYVTRPYAHKNFAFLGEFLAKLTADGISCTCLVTLTHDEVQSLDPLTRAQVTNIGPLSLDKVPRLYEQADAALFPSLLEAFSAMPLEAMKMGLPVIASDRDFVRSVCGSAPIYIDPLDPLESASYVAQRIHRNTFTDGIESGLQTVSSLPSARDRATAFAAMVSELT